jgi:hypothetical protein
MRRFIVLLIPLVFIILSFSYTKGGGVQDGIDDILACADNEYTESVLMSGGSANFSPALAANQVSYTVPLAEAAKHFTSHVGTGVIVTVLVNTQTRTIISVSSPLASTSVDGGYNPAGRNGSFNASWANRYNQLLPAILAAYANKPVDPIINVDFGARGNFSNAIKLRLSSAGIPLYNTPADIPNKVPDVIITGATTAGNLSISFGNLAHSVQYALRQMVLLAQLDPPSA